MTAAAKVPVHVFGERSRDVTGHDEAGNEAAFRGSVAPRKFHPGDDAHEFLVNLEVGAVGKEARHDHHLDQRRLCIGTAHVRSPYRWGVADFIGIGGWIIIAWVLFALGQGWLTP